MNRTKLKLPYELLLGQWEEIVKRSSEANGNFEYINFMKTKKSALLIANNYVVIKAILTKLTLVPDLELIKYLKTKGIAIDISDYANSLIKAGKTADNYLNRFKIKESELKEFSKDGKKPHASFEEALANVSVGLGFEVKDDITLAKYNEYKNIIKKKHAATKKFSKLKQ